MNLELTSWYIWNNSNTQDVATDVTPDLAKLAFGDEYQGYFTYTTDAAPIRSTTEIRFNPGMFVTEGFDNIANLGGDETYYLKKKGITNVFTDFEWVGDANAFTTTSNVKYEIRRRSNVSFEIRITFFMLSDTRTYLGAAGITGGQYSRLTADRFSPNPQTFNNTQSTIYTVNQTIDNYTLGMYVGLVIDVQAVEPVTIQATGGAPTSTSPFELIVPVGYNFITDGWSNPCGSALPTNVSLTLYELGTAASAVYFEGVLDPTLTTATKLVFTSSTNFPVALDAGNYAIEVSADDCALTELYGVLKDPAARVRTWDYLNIDGLFVDDGIHSNRVYQLTRSGLDVNTINVNVPTTINFDFTYTGSFVNRANLWMIPAGMVNTTTDNWFDNLDRTAIQFTPVDTINNVGGNDWEITKLIDPLALNLQLGDIFHFLFVLYDDADNYYASYVYQNVPVSNIQEIPDDGVYCGEELDITGNLSTYKDEFLTDYLQVSPLQRVKATTYYDKESYNTCSDFNRIQKITATLELLDGTVLRTANINVTSGVASSTNPSIFITDSAPTLQIDWAFRIEDAYTNKEIRVKWVVNSLTEPTETIFYQQFKVDDYQQNLAPGDQIFIDTIFRDLGGFILGVDDGRNCSGEDIIVETVRDLGRGADDYAQAAVWLDGDRRVEEHDGFTQSIDNLPELNFGFQSLVEEQFTTNAPDDIVTHQITSSIQTGEVGMVGYPPPFDNNASRVMWHHTNPNGRNITFTLQKAMLLGPKVFGNLAGLASTADYSFRIGSTVTALVDANNAGWAAFPSISWIDLFSVTAPAGTVIRVEYNGSTTDNTDIVSYMDYFTDEAPNFLNTLIKTLLTTRVAANDIMLYTGIPTNFIDVRTPSSTRYTEKRSAAELLANSDLTDYDAGSIFPIATWNPPNDTTANHLLLEANNSTGNNFIEIDVNTVEPNFELSTYATPLTNAFYPITGNGTNVDSYSFDGINDFGRVTDLTTFNYANPYNDTGDDYIRYTFRVRMDSGLSRFLDIQFNNSITPIRVQMVLTTIGVFVQYQWQSPAETSLGYFRNIAVGVGTNHTVDIYLPVLTDISETVADYFARARVFVDGKLSPNAVLSGRATFRTMPLTSPFLLFGSNGVANLYAASTLQTFAIERTSVVDFESVRRRYLGLEEMTPYKWNFGRIGDLVANQVPPENLGPSIVMVNCDNTKSNFFI